MLFQVETVNRLKDVGLNSYEARLWISLLSRGVSTAGELSDIANVPRSRSYDVLESLEKKGFIIMKLGKPIKYIAVNPTEVINRVKVKVEKKAESQIKVLESMKSTKFIDELDSLYSQGINHIEATDMTGVIKGRSNVYNHLSFMIKNAKKSVFIATTEEGIIRKSKSLRNSLKKAKEKGVKIKIVAPLTNKNKEFLGELKKNALIKHSINNTSRFCVVDGKETLMMLLHDSEIHPNYDAGVWVNTEYFAKNGESIFTNLWNNAKKL